MANLDPTKFRVSSALKTIIGKELITDDFIAVFELVKNSFDAHSKRVDVIFEDIYGDNPCLTIWDDGKGMDLTDIVDKWLFVAYSAKKEGVEDYRDKIKSNRIHAGAKGIGRFSCDKLGSKLVLYSRKKNEKSTHKLEIQWADFEKDSKKEFIKIPVDYSLVQNVPYEGFNKGTILEITGLREKWDRDKLLRLRHSLEKLINPNQENDPRGFSIYLNVEEELKNDKEKENDGKVRDIINGKVENRVFEDLGIKTSRIDTFISNNGTIIETRLEDKGSLIYQIKEKNIFKGLLKNIRITLFFLNQSAKLTFSKKMGMPAVEYGAVFLYKNGFRIYPFGEEGEDILKIDRRKGQGYARFLGTREIIGRIEINGVNEDFKETSSRDGGLIKNKNHEALEKYFYDYALKRLEKYVNEVIKWGRYGELEELRKQDPKAIKKQIADIILNLTNSKELLDVNYDSRFVDILEDRTEKNLNKILINLKRLAEQTSSDLVLKEISRVERKYKSLLKAKEEAEAEAKEARKEAKEAKRKEEIEVTQNLFLQSVLSQDRKVLLNFHHHIGIAADTIKDYVLNLTRKLRKGTLSTDKILSSLQKISYQVEQIISLSRFATKANFKLKGTEIRADLIGFIKEHLLNVYTGILKFSGSELKVQYEETPGEKCVCRFKPIEITVILENLLSNSKKAEASVVKINAQKQEKGAVKLIFSDNGKGVSEENAKKIFDMGFTTTNGSGLGLFHVKEILKKMGGSIKYNVQTRGGAEFILTLRGEI